MISTYCTKCDKCGKWVRVIVEEVVFGGGIKQIKRIALEHTKQDATKPLKVKK